MKNPSQNGSHGSKSGSVLHKGVSTHTHTNGKVCAHTNTDTRTHTHMHARTHTHARSAYPSEDVSHIVGGGTLERDDGVQPRHVPVPAETKHMHQTHTGMKSEPPHHKVPFYTT